MANISELSNQFTINGVLSTDDSVLSNMEKLASSCGCWITYDIHAGKWSVIINRAGVSTRSFTDSTIVGPVNLSSTGLTDLYNSIRVTYPRVDLNDATDWIQIDLPAADRNYNEPDQRLEMTLPMTNDPVQAQLIGLIELKQSRVDKVISFQTDYTAIDLNAGDIIDVTNSTLGFDEKLFRILSMREVDDETGAIRIEITALEYDAAVYDNDLERFTVSTDNGIVTIGDIGIPDTPQITIFERDARPRTVLEATVPTGLVTGMEFWLSQSSNVSGFQLVGIERPVSGTTFSSGDAVTIDVDNINAGNVFVKTRAFNSSLTGPYSNVASSTYTPVQVTNAVDPNTGVIDSTGNLLTALAITELMKLLDGLYSNGNTSPGSLFEKIFDIFDSQTGVNILGDIGNIANNSANASFTTISANATTLSADTSSLLTINAGPNVTITGSSLSNEITIDAVGGGGTANVGNIIVGNVSLPLADDVELVDNFATPNNIYWDTVLNIQANSSPTPNQILFAAEPGPATLGWIRMGRSSVSGGPFNPAEIITLGNVSVTQTNTPIFCHAVFNWVSNTTGDDTFKRVDMTLNINGSNVATTADSSRTQDGYENMVLNLYYTGNCTVGDTTSLIFSLESDLAIGCDIDYIVFQPYAA